MQYLALFFLFFAYAACHVHTHMAVLTEFAEDDGMKCNEVGGWTEEKYRLIASYFKQFSTGTKKAWSHRVFLDLYAGAGYSKLRPSGQVVKGSPILALSVRDTFDQYIFCEANEASYDALKARVDRDFANENVTCILGDCDQKIDQIIGSLPRRDSLGLCFVDPYNLGIKFETITKLAERRLDILCLLALHMDANRAYDVYLNQESSKVDQFLGSSSWKSEWLSSGRPRNEFPKFLADCFARQMRTLGFEETPTHSMHLVRSDDRNVPLYHLALFSRNQLAYKFWGQAREYSNDQRSLW